MRCKVSGIGSEVKVSNISASIWECLHLISYFGSLGANSSDHPIAKYVETYT